MQGQPRWWVAPECSGLQVLWPWINPGFVTRARTHRTLRPSQNQYFLLYCLIRFQTTDPGVRTR